MKEILMKKLDCMGDFCPIPTLKTTNEVQKLKPGETLQIMVDHSCAVANIKEAIKDHICDYQVNEVANGIWEISIKKR
jgi:tRNA 2-thiouridine synthesizing protein A